MTLLHEIGFHLGAIFLTMVSFRVYYDGLERLSNLEAGLWAVAVLLTALWRRSPSTRSCWRPPWLR
ncbi:hypothetical protein [Haladaptatus sp. DFWS20]|uniref:hypothetical protein n=1 Tax=Haladaptatus sp. DFWS20 TaxID=3403467 RepID=UPI003EB989C2